MLETNFKIIKEMKDKEETVLVEGVVYHEEVPGSIILPKHDCSVLVNFEQFAGKGHLYRKGSDIVMKGKIYKKYLNLIPCISGLVSKNNKGQIRKFKLRSIGLCSINEDHSITSLKEVK